MWSSQTDDWPQSYSSRVFIHSDRSMIVKIFIPLTDDMLEQLNKEDQPIPYQVGVSLLSQNRSDGPGSTLNQDEASAHPLVSHPTPLPCPH
jgi:hypothetical protein